MCTTAIYRVEDARVRERWCDGAESVAAALRVPPEGAAGVVLLRGDGGWQSSKAGGRYRELTLDTMSFTVFELEGGADFEAHRHPNAQITCVLDGELTFELESGRHVLGPGDAIGIPGGVVHAVRAENGPVRAVDSWAPPATHLE